MSDLSEALAYARTFFNTDTNLGKALAQIFDAAEGLVTENESEFIDPIHNVQSIGPFLHYPIVINSWSVPHLEAQETHHGVTVTLDQRLVIDLNADTTPGAIISFIADCIAVAKGYACHPRKDGWADEDRLNSPTNPAWPWVHVASADHIEAAGEGER